MDHLGSVDEGSNLHVEGKVLVGNVEEDVLTILIVRHDSMVHLAAIVADGKEDNSCQDNNDRAEEVEVVREGQEPLQIHGMAIRSSVYECCYEIEESLDARNNQYNMKRDLACFI